MKIIYAQPDGTAAVVVPSAEALSKYTIQQIAAKDVPAGVEYRIVEDDVIPSDRTFRNAWEVDTSVPADGVGNTSNTFE